MNPWIGWALAAAALAAGWFGYGVRGIALAVTVIAFWLLLQFNRLVRVMRTASESPVGRIDNAVMLHAKLQVGLPMAKVIGLTKSLGRRADEAGEVYTWTDGGGASVAVTFTDGRCASWELTRPAE
jgi:hypothetical protein